MRGTHAIGTLFGAGSKAWKVRRMKGPAQRGRGRRGMQEPGLQRASFKKGISFVFACQLKEVTIKKRNRKQAK